LCVLAEIYQSSVLDLIDFRDREKFTAPELLTLDKTGAAPLPAEAAAPLALIFRTQSPGDEFLEMRGSVPAVTLLRARLNELLASLTCSRR
jgi:hypothetical protein